MLPEYAGTYRYLYVHSVLSWLHMLGTRCICTGVCEKMDVTNYGSYMWLTDKGTPAW